ncbi:MAG: hypothetical protein IT381_25390 [Deltaproteobacteria bacterium]|nr:hypothetical protein [Deltaproteobacteria bacterium]
MGEPVTAVSTGRVIAEIAPTYPVGVLSAVSDQRITLRPGRSALVTVVFPPAAGKDGAGRAIDLSIGAGASLKQKTVVTNTAGYATFEVVAGDAAGKVSVVAKTKSGQAARFVITILPPPPPPPPPADDRSTLTLLLALFGLL